MLLRFPETILRQITVKGEIRIQRDTQSLRNNMNGIEKSILQSANLNRVFTLSFSKMSARFSELKKKLKRSMN